MHSAGRLAFAALLVAACSACGNGGEVGAEERADLARDAAREVVSRSPGMFIEVEGEPAVTIQRLRGGGTGAVQVLPGRSYPASRERQCTRLGVRLVPYGERGPELLPIVADAFEAAFDVPCGIP